MRSIGEKADMALGIIIPAILAFLAGRLDVFGEPVIISAYMAALLLNGREHKAAGLAGLAGVYLSFGDTVLAAYMVLTAGLLIVGNIRSIVWLRHRPFLLAFYNWLFYFAVKVVFYELFNFGNSYIEILAKSGLVFALTVILAKGMETITGDMAEMVSDPEAAVSVLICLGIFLQAVPLAVGNVTIALFVGIFTVLYINYRFGMGLGFSWTVICGLILSVRLSNPDYVVAFTVVMLAASGLYNLLGMSRALFAVIYLAVYAAAGIFAYDVLVNVSGVQAVLSAVTVFLLVPAAYIAPVRSSGKYGCQGVLSPEWSGLVMNRLSGFTDALKRIDYTMSDAATGMSLGEVVDIIDGFSEGGYELCTLRKSAEAGITAGLGKFAIETGNIMLMKNKQDRYEVYITMRCRGIRTVHTGRIQKLLEDNLRTGLVPDEDNRMLVGREYVTYIYREKPVFNCVVAIRSISRYEGVVSGDNFYSGDINKGQQLVMISDGMGSGETACESSRNLIDAMEELLGAGVDRELAIRLVNAYLSEKNRGESFATMDMLIIDRYTGYGRLFKHGAATTYIRRRDWVEEIKSTSLPMGVDEEACCETAVKKFYDGDIIVMMSDGVYENLIYENEDDFIRQKLLDMTYDDPDEIADYLMTSVREKSHRHLADDATVVVTKVVKRV
jgi:stage II sporulation protein E